MAQRPLRRSTRPDALMFKVPPAGSLQEPIFVTPESDDVAFWRRLGWHLLADEEDVKKPEAKG